MPYSLKGDCVVKTDTGETVPGGCHKNHEEALAHLRALEANVKQSGIVEMSLRITKASYQKSDRAPMKWAAIDSDTDPDLYAEQMSPELYTDFCSRIENKSSVPEQFQEVICEQDWCGGMPYLSIAHFKAGSGMVNVPGSVDSVYMDGSRLKSKGTLSDSPMGRRVFESLREDLYMEKSGNTAHPPVRISIGFLDLEHEHVPQSAGGQHYTFTRSDTGQICPLCAQGIGGKIYKKGQLIHLAMTRVPVNPRTRMSVEKSMEEDIITKRDDAKSIIGELADGLEEKSIANDILVVRSEDGSAPTPDSSPTAKCYDPNTGGWDNACIAAVFDKFMADCRDMIGATVKSLTDEVVEDAKRKDVTPADKKQAEKEYGDVTYADEANKKYPIDTKEHAKAALSYWGMPKNREKYSPEDQKKIGGRIRAAAKKFGIEVTDKKSGTVEEAMDENTNTTVDVEKGVMGIPEKPFDYAGLDGNGNNTIAAPVKAKADDEEDAKDNGKDEVAEGEMKKKSSAMDESYAQLKSALASAKSVEEVQAAFNALGQEVEKSYTPPAPTAGDMIAAFADMLEKSLAPIKMEIATLKAQGNTVSTQAGVVKSKALNFNPLANTNDPNVLMQRALSSQTVQQSQTRKIPGVPAQISDMARRSTGALHD